jgi:hypothetical protein
MEVTLIEQINVMYTWYQASIADSCPDWYQWINHLIVMTDSFVSRV